MNYQSKIQDYDRDLDYNDNNPDIDNFDRNYEQYILKRKKNMKQKMALRLAELNNDNPIDTPIYSKNIASIIIDTKDALFDLLDDLLQHKFTIDTFTKNNRMFYIGLILILIALFIYIYNIIIGDHLPYKDANNSININHIHYLKKN